MKCKCKWQACKKDLTTDKAYKVVIDGKNAYFCREAHYYAYMEEQEFKEKKKADKIRRDDLIAEIFGYQVINSALYKEMSVINKVANDSKIADYLAENKAYLHSVMQRDFSSEYGKIRYFSTIIKNNIKDFKPKVVEVVRPKVVVEETIYETPTHTLNKRRSLADLEDDL